MRTSIVLITLLIFASCTIPERAETFTTIDGEKIDLDGKVAINFWASWCPPCEDEMPLLDTVHSDTGWTVIAVNLQEPPDTVERFRERLNLSLPIVLDPDRSIRDSYAVRSQPVTFFLEDGEIIDVRFGILTGSDFERLGVEAEVGSADVSYLDDGTPFLVHPDELREGGPGKDGIPSIDDPQFITAQDSNLADDELVLGLIYEGEARAYPFRILVWHELVNDEIAGDPLLVSYCPLCGTGIVFERHLEGVAVEFGVSGKLYNSDLIMYDRLTNTYWEQLTGRAIIGERTGIVLEKIPSDVMPWSRWQQRHPDTLVLSDEARFDRPYGRDPYLGYYDAEGLMFPVENEDDRLHPKEVVYGFERDGRALAITQDSLEEYSGEIGGERFIIDTSEGVVAIFNDERVALTRSFWFAWAAFHPETELVSG
jgi:thiol-disulfide isomerase/thioredoxin